MFEIPIFPLNTVLFPGTPLQLHIFEERYKRMVSTCLADRTPFGVVLIRHGRESLGPLAEPFRIGCTAQIIQAEQLDGGRMNITTLGKERIRILKLDNKTRPYLVGQVETYPLSGGDGPDLNAPRNELRLRLGRYLARLSAAQLMELNEPDLPGNPVLLAYLAAAVLHITPIQKQQILSISDARNLLVRLVSVYDRELALLEKFLHEPAETNDVFSRN
jgi:Lon protease-like protein